MQPCLAYKDTHRASSSVACGSSQAPTQDQSLEEDEGSYIVPEDPPNGFVPRSQVSQLVTLEGYLPIIPADQPQATDAGCVPTIPADQPQAVPEVCVPMIQPDVPAEPMDAVPKDRVANKIPTQPSVECSLSQAPANDHDQSPEANEGGCIIPEDPQPPDASVPNRPTDSGVRYI